jgi:hypothetical protein
MKTRCARAFLAVVSSVAALACFAACAATSGKPHDYRLDGNGKAPNQKSWTTPSETFDGNSLGNMPQSR